jgi:hypothetical protein
MRFRPTRHVWLFNVDSTASHKARLSSHDDFWVVFVRRRVIEDSMRLGAVVFVDPADWRATVF